MQQGEYSHQTPGASSECIPTCLAKTLYTSLIYPYLVYCSLIMDGMKEGLKDKLQIYQNAALKAVLSVENDYRTDLLRCQIGVHSIRSLTKGFL